MNKVPKRVSGLKAVKVTGQWEKLHDEELHNLHFLLFILRMIKLRTILWTEYVACMGK
jgi:hypothetical protein